MDFIYLVNVGRYVALLRLLTALVQWGKGGIELERGGFIELVILLCLWPTVEDGYLNLGYLTFLSRCCFLLSFF